MRAKLALLKELVLTLGISCVLLSGLLQAQTITPLHIFTSTPDGAYPNAILAQGRDGFLYGTTEQGGTNTCSDQGYTTGCGTIFKMDSAGNVTILHEFSASDGSEPKGLVLASDGYFYGAAAFNGTYGFGTLFRISAGGLFTKLHDFTNTTDGEYPQGQLLQASDGNLYGLTEIGLYRATASGVVTMIYRFTGNPVTNNTAPLIQATNGSLYATMGFGWCNGSTCPCGSVVKFNLQGSLVSEHDFSCYNLTNGNAPSSPVIQAADGNFYGTNVNGGSGSRGTAFELSPQNIAQLTLLHNFDITSEYPYAGLVQGTDGNFYGVTKYSSLTPSGTVYQLTRDGLYSELAGLPYNEDDFPYWSLIQHTSGKFYSSVYFAESQPGYYGFIYSFDNGFGPFITFVRPQARIGGTAQILGQGFRGAWAVTFNGLPATSFKVVSDTFMTAVVPTGATTGPVVVTTPRGTLTSNRKFQIVQ